MYLHFNCLPYCLPTFSTQQNMEEYQRVELYNLLDWSGRRDSNSRHSRWQRDALPLSYARLI